MKQIKTVSLVALPVLAMVALSGCQPSEPTPNVGETLAPQEAVATLEPTEGNQVSGTVRFVAEGNTVRVIAEITGLTPGKHGFHIHEKGDCSAPDGSSAGGHFNPTGMPHGSPDAEQHHVGDLGNLTADASGKATLDRAFAFLSLDGENSIVGRGLIVHAGADDLKTQPTGNAGARVACGVITATAGK
jgi:Cu-Zn family superoxide dismutase